jgi:hypothetical protein
VSQELAFGSKKKQKRFATKEDDQPGPGTYEFNPSVQIKDRNRENSIFKSSLKRENKALWQEVPGAGQYDVQNHLGISKIAV